MFFKASRHSFSVSMPSQLADSLSFRTVSFSGSKKLISGSFWSALDDFPWAIAEHLQVASLKAPSQGEYYFYIFETKEPGNDRSRICIIISLAKTVYMLDFDSVVPTV